MGDFPRNVPLPSRVQVGREREQTLVSDDPEKLRDTSKWLRDRAEAAELLAADMIVPEAKRDMRALAEIYRRWADRTAGRSARKKPGSTP